MVNKLYDKFVANVFDPASLCAKCAAFGLPRLSSKIISTQTRKLRSILAQITFHFGILTQKFVEKLSDIKSSDRLLKSYAYVLIKIMHRTPTETQRNEFVFKRGIIYIRYGTRIPPNILVTVKHRQRKLSIQNEKHNVSDVRLLILLFNFLYYLGTYVPLSSPIYR